MNKITILKLLVLLLPITVFGQQISNTNQSKFKQLGEILPTPNNYRTASGAPGHQYWQQQADYVIDVSLDDEKQQIHGFETITYHNNSPDQLTYLWVQLDQNRRAKDSDTYSTYPTSLSQKITFDQLQGLKGSQFDGGYKILEVKDKSNAKLSYTINKTMMRVDLPKPLKSGEKIEFSIKWWYNINNQPEIGGRSGYEYFEKDGNYLYEIAQWFPRMAVYDDVNGWQNKQFLGRGEFALPFGDYKVSITVPNDHIVASTGTLQNPDKVLTKTQLDRLEKAKTATAPVMIVSQEEAEKNEQSKPTGTKTWTFEAKNVRDFAWASSRKFIWDAMGQKVGDKTVMCMSYYPKEGNPLWGKYSTEVVAHTVKTYSKYTVNYEYPVAISVHGPVGGMEYPMISFNGARPEADGTYPESTKLFLISVIIHEVGHNFFPMIINSDERQWTWMDEGLNTFVQFLTEQEWDRNYPSRRGPARKIVDYMKGTKDNIMPIMTNSESIKQFGNNAYGKPATALNILRETIMGRDLFDFAFKTYCTRWAYKHPTPADFFRTMEDASGVDLDWFWHGWFYTTDNVDISLDKVTFLEMESLDPKMQSKIAKDKLETMPIDISKQKNKTAIEKTVLEKKPHLKDFYDKYDPYGVDKNDLESYDQYCKALSKEENDLLCKKHYVYQLDFTNNGGLVMPLIIQMKFADGTDKVVKIPAEIWRYNEKTTQKVFSTDKEVVEFVLDPFLETADVNLENNFYPRKPIKSKFQIFKQQQQKQQNPMQKSKENQDKS